MDDEIQVYKIRKHYYVGACPQCDKHFGFRRKWRVQREWEKHRLHVHPTFMDAIRSTTVALRRFAAVLGE
jgi:hypothetical protein